MVMAAGVAVGVAKKIKGRIGGRRTLRKGRRRRRASLTMSEVMKISMMRSLLNPRGRANDPITTLVTMKALGGRL
jgi:hypothetical protein